MKYMMPMKDLKNMPKDVSFNDQAALQDMKKAVHRQNKNYVTDRDYETRWHKGHVPPESPRGNP